MKSIFSRILPLFLVFVIVSCSCANSQKISQSKFSPLNYQALPASTALAMMQTTVQVHVEIKSTMYRENEETGQTESEPLDQSWVGSGVVYENDGKKSKILSANHVLDTPKVGSIEPVSITFFGIELVLGWKKINSVKITVTTNDEQTCNVKPLVLGISDYRDVATAEVDCDAGRVAKIARATPVQGERVYVSGHPLGVPIPVLTEGFVSGMWSMAEGKFLMISAGAYGGNSGGPVFHNGEVIGLLVRGSRDYTNISLATPLEQILLRISDTP